MTPLMDALRNRAAGSALRFHMPAHAGRSVIPGWDLPFAIDFTELPDTGSLYDDAAGGPIREAERLYAESYAADDCLFLTGGATQGILAMLASFAAPGGKVLLDRNSHISAHNALALLDLRPIWLQAPTLSPFSVSAGMPARAVRDALETSNDAACVMITSPTYYGVLSDIPAIADVCRARGVPLLVDAAHGAHLPFLPGFASPVSQGAAAAVMSAHKTLPALGQTAFLLTGAAAGSSLLRGRAALFGSSSPSFVLMASLDAARDYMDNGGKKDLGQVAKHAARLRNTSPYFLGHAPVAAPGEGFDPMRLSLHTGRGKETAARLERDAGIVCEMADALNVVFLLSPLTTRGELDRLAEAAERLRPELPPVPRMSRKMPPPLPDCPVTPRMALFGKRETLPWRECRGRTAACPVVTYPPGVPLAAGGETISGHVMEALEQNQFEGNITVVVSKRSCQ